jgi:asparagine synthase (glutamine-hydrolysing)
MLRTGRWGRVAADLWHCLRRRRLPKVGFRTRLRWWLGKTRLRPLLGQQAPWQFPLPEWLDPDFARRLRLADRLREVNEEEETDRRQSPHRTRPEAYGVLQSCHFIKVFDYCDPAIARSALEVRHPYLDLRVVKFFLGIPPVPWCDNKELVREALRGLLPEVIRLRPKAVLAGDPDRERLRQRGVQWIDRFIASEELSRYVNRAAVPPLAGETDTQRIQTHLRPLSLQIWLRNRNSFRVFFERKVNRHGTAEPAPTQEAVSHARTA